MTTDRRLAPLERSSLAALAYTSIRTSIIEGRIPQGERVYETRLASELATSRGPIREALGRLREEGLIEERNGQGSFVRVIGAAELLDTYNLRIGIETTAARLIVRRGGDLAPLQAIVVRMHRRASDHDAAGILEEDFRFHETLCELSGNRALADMFRSINARIRMGLLVNVGPSEQPPDLREWVASHERALAGIACGDEQKAARAVHAEILEGIPEILERLGADTRLLLPSS